MWLFFLPFLSGDQGRRKGYWCLVLGVAPWRKKSFKRPKSKNEEEMAHPRRWWVVSADRLGVFLAI